MTKTEHTKGPWKACEHGVIADTITSHGNFYVASAIDPENAEDKANMLLLAAAPDLLAACEASIVLIKNTWPMEHGNPEVGKAWGLVEAAIYKARGNA